MEQEGDKQTGRQKQIQNTRWKRRDGDRNIHHEGGNYKDTERERGRPTNRQRQIVIDREIQNSDK